MRCLVCLLLGLLLLPQTLLAAPVVLFDEGHAQPFLARGERPLDLSSLAGIFTAAGYEVRTCSQPLDPAQLAGVDVLVSSGAFRPFAPEEVAAVRAFVAAGGGLAVMLHIAPPFEQLLHAFEIEFTNYTLREQNHVIGNNRQDFRVSVQPHVLTENLRDFAVYGAWALRGTTPVIAPLGQTSEHGWVDLNGDRQLSVGDAVQSFVVAVAGSSGHGRFAVFGDDALFQNRYLEGNNRKLAENLVRWLRVTDVP
ncbi:MAG: DUF4350 domain-containing protein [Deltaproteobacteria bacterium]|nr:MAG: DUF4350 domain-containing protein [Deltaproteobacteria bacterium]